MVEALLKWIEEHGWVMLIIGVVIALIQLCCVQALAYAMWEKPLVPVGVSWDVVWAWFGVFVVLCLVDAAFAAFVDFALFTKPKRDAEAAVSRAETAAQMAVAACSGAQVTQQRVEAEKLQIARDLFIAESRLAAAEQWLDTQGKRVVSSVTFNAITSTVEDKP